MSNVTIPYRFLVRGGTAAAVGALNEIPLAREIIVETDTRKLKIGDGSTHYNSLTYFNTDSCPEGTNLYFTNERAQDALAAAFAAGTHTGITVTYSDAGNSFSLAVTGGVSDGDKGDITVSSSGSVWTVDNAAISLAKMANVATATVFYRKTAGTGAPEVQTLATLKTDLGLTGTNSGDQTITLTGDVTGSGAGSFAATVANNAVTYAKMQDVSATSRILGRKTAGSGDPEECTLSQVLDFVGSAADGDILIRSGGVWIRRGIGSTGQVLSVSSGGVPVWGAAGSSSGGATTLIGTTTIAGAAATTLTLPALDLAADGRYVVYLKLKNATASNSSISLFYNSDTTVTNYDRQTFAEQGTGNSGARANDAIFFSLLANTTLNAKIEIDTDLDGKPRAMFTSNADITTNLSIRMAAHMWRTASNVTLAALSSSVASAFAIGCEAKVYKVN